MFNSYVKLPEGSWSDFPHIFVEPDSESDLSSWVFSLFGFLWLGHGWGESKHVLCWWFGMWHSATYISWKSNCALSKVPISLLPNTKTLSMHCSTTVNPHFGSFWGLSSHQTLGGVFPTGMWAAFVTWKLPPSVILSKHLRPLELTEAIPGAAWPSGVVLGSTPVTVCVAVRCCWAPFPLLFINPSHGVNCHPWWGHDPETNGAQTTWYGILPYM